MNLVSRPLVLSALFLFPGAAPRAEEVSRTRASEVQYLGRCSDQGSSAAVTFEDEKLEAAVRSALSVAENVVLTCGLVSELTSLVASEAGIVNLSGIQSLTGLEDLDLWDNAISDISQLVGLTGLARLYLGQNSIVEVSALSGLTNLALLQIRENKIADISALVGLTQLTNLDISYNNISDISGLSGMTRLTTLRVYNNPITDIGAMRGMTNLSELHVHDLPDLSTIQPLVENTGLGEGDLVYVGRSNVCSEVRGLKDKGVRVPGCEMESAWHWWWAILLGVGLVAVGAKLVTRRNERRWAAWRAEEAK